jgi:putative ABC transport system permease protein
MRMLFREVLEGLRIAGRAIWANKLRSLLTTLGIIIGIASVTAMATVINGIEQRFEQSLSSLGTDVLHVRVWPLGGTQQWWKYINRPDLDPRLADVIAERSRYATATMPEADRSQPVRHGGTELESVQVLGVGAAFPEIRQIGLQAGRFFSDTEARSGRYTIVLGSSVASELFPVAQPLGKKIRVGEYRFQVVGVLERQGSGLFGESIDNQVVVPFETFERAFSMENENVDIEVKVAATDLMTEATSEITGILRVERGLGPKQENNFEVDQQEDVRSQLAPVKIAIYGVGIFLTALSLLVGGIGVMNIMFVSVKERTKEIGIRKAVGAKKRTILLQFLIEAIIICLIGGALGIALSVGLTAGINALLGVSAFLPMETVALAFGICTAVGVGFGLAPAWSGAQAEPVEALRYE